MKLLNKLPVTMVTIMLLLTLKTIAQKSGSLVPLPVSLTEKKGNSTLSGSVSIFCNEPSLFDALQLFSSQLALTSGIKSGKTANQQQADIIIIKQPDYKPGQYSLNINSDKIVLKAATPQGAFYAGQTLMQLCPPEIFGNKKSIAGKIKLPCMEINDYPRFPYRGMHLDVCRHFFPKEFVMKYIDFIAMHKMNYFHFHLTDDQGWRIEIKKYPKLTEIGSKRKGTLIGSYSDVPHRFDTIAYGGYYTQDDIRQIVDYAAKRYVTVIPEIEMPGHAMAAIAAYPELSCTKKQIDVSTIWGVFDDVFCNRESTFEFMENVLTEVIALFPSPYIHIGGDECPKVRWKECPDCQNRMKEQGLKTEEELQSYFIHRMEKFLNSKGKQIIGWDEILEGGLAPNATVMSWRGIDGAIAAAKEKHYAIMTPGTHCYLDHYQSLSLNEPIAIGGYTPLMKVYDFEPIPSELTTDQQKYILGAQGNIWTEYILNEAHVEYMAFPRLCALAEVNWTPPERKNEADFKKRLIHHLLRLKAMNVNFAKHVFDPEVTTSANEKAELEITLTPMKASDIIRYAINHEPTDQDPIYTKPVTLTSASTFYCRAQGEVQGSLLSVTFYKSASFGANLTLKHAASDRYPGAKGAATLVDGLKGGKRYDGQNWLGFSGDDMEAVIDLGSKKSISEVAVGSMDIKGSWIHPPKRLQVYTSNDGIDYKIVSDASAPLDADGIAHSATFKEEARYVKIIAQNQGIIPDGFQGAGHKAWLFIDEIMVK